MTKKILVTGGAGFIGSHLVDFLIEKSNFDVTVYDQLEEQVHGKDGNLPDYMNKNARFIRGSVTDYEKFEEVVKSNDFIFHLAARVGVGQSMYQISNYIDNNIIGMANLLDILVNSEHNVRKVVVASSNTVYGEGKAFCSKCGTIYPNLRQLVQLQNKDWELNCPNCGSKVKPAFTDENTPHNPSSIYALSKKVQEELSLMIGDVFGINIAILRFFLVYGPRQALSNPYTGVCAIFSSRLLNGNHPIVFEDGFQSRDFVNVSDICQASLLALKSQAANGEIFNVGSGIPITIREVAETIVERINPALKPIYNQQYRVGDVRHCVADISKIKSTLGYEPKIAFHQGIDDFINWIRTKQTPHQDNSDLALTELRKKDLLK